MKAAIFDMDGTLLNSMQMWGDMFPVLMKECGVVPDEHFSKDTNSLTMLNIANYMVKHYSLDIDPLELYAHWQTKLKNAYKTEVTLKADIIPYLVELKSRGVKLAVATLTEHSIADEAIKMHGLEEFFDYILTPEDVNGVTKLRPDLFLKGAELLGSDPSETVIYEDSFYAMQPALSVGFKVYAISDPRAEPYKERIEAIATKYFKSWQDAINDLEKVPV